MRRPGDSGVKQLARRFKSIQNCTSIATSFPLSAFGLLREQKTFQRDSEPIFSTFLEVVVSNKRSQSDAPFARAENLSTRFRVDFQYIFGGGQLEQRAHQFEVETRTFFAFPRTIVQLAPPPIKFEFEFLQLVFSLRPTHIQSSKAKATATARTPAYRILNSNSCSWSSFFGLHLRLSNFEFEFLHLVLSVFGLQLCPSNLNLNSCSWSLL